MVSQNTIEWLKLRKNHVGASDAPIIMQVSPYKTAYQLWEQKLDLCPSDAMNAGMQRGLDLEDQARQELERMTGLFFLPQVMFHKEHSWMMASLDAVDPSQRHIAEIKCPNAHDHAMAIDGKIPEKYIPQLQHQLEVCELDESYYFSYNGINGVLVKVFRDEEYIKKMLEKEKKFWDCLQTWTAPELTDRDYQLKTDEMWEMAATEWANLNKQMKILEAKEKSLREMLISMSNKRNSMGSGIKVSRFFRRGAVNYDSIPELKEIELEKYRKPSVECYKISTCGK